MPTNGWMTPYDVYSGALGMSDARMQNRIMAMKLKTLQQDQSFQAALDTLGQGANALGAQQPPAQNTTQNPILSPVRLSMPGGAPRPSAGISPSGGVDQGSPAAPATTPTNALSPQAGQSGQGGQAGIDPSDPRVQNIAKQYPRQWAAYQADQQTLLQEQIKSAAETAERIAQVNHRAGEVYWNNHPLLSRLGPASIPEEEGPVTVGGKVIGYRVKMPGGKYQFVKGSADRAPTVHSFTVGDKRVDKQWDPATGRWVTVSSGPRKLDEDSGSGTWASSGTGTDLTKVPAGETNEEALQGLSAADRALVNGLVNYKIPLPSGMALRSPKWQKILAAATGYDPTFDVTQYNARQRLRVDFNSGKAAVNIRSLNTAIGHLDTLKKKADALGNRDMPIWNTIANKGLSAIGDKRVVEFNMAANAVESELAATFKGMGATDQEIKAWRENLNAAQSPEQLKGAIDTAIELMRSRLEALQSQYETGMGKPKDFHFLAPKARKILQNMGLNPEEIDPGNTGGKEPAAQKGSGQPAGSASSMPDPKANAGSKTSKAVSYLRGATSRPDAISRIKALAKVGWGKDDLESIAREAGWE